MLNFRKSSKFWGLIYLAKYALFSLLELVVSCDKDERLENRLIDKLLEIVEKLSNLNHPPVEFLAKCFHFFSTRNMVSKPRVLNHVINHVFILQTTHKNLKTCARNFKPRGFFRFRWRENSFGINSKNPAISFPTFRPSASWILRGGLTFWEPISMAA